jgi:hypothetical protein
LSAGLGASSAAAATPRAGRGLCGWSLLAQILQRDLNDSLIFEFDVDALLEKITIDHFAPSQRGIDDLVPSGHLAFEIGVILIFVG